MPRDWCKCAIFFFTRNEIIELELCQNSLFSISQTERKLHEITTCVHLCARAHAAEVWNFMLYQNANNFNDLHLMREGEAISNDFRENHHMLANLSTYFSLYKKIKPIIWTNE